MLTLATALLVSFFACVLLTPIVRGVVRRFGWVDHHERRSTSDQPIPRMGGVAVISAAVIGVALSYLVLAFTRSPALHDVQTIVQQLLWPSLIVLAVGIADDIFSLSPLIKISGETLAAVALVHSGVRLDTVFAHPLSVVLSLVATVVWILACTNAYNLIDGLDGLATGLAVFASGTVFIHALLTGRLALAIVTLALSGALLAFLKFNFFPASIFLGDSGSLTIGFLLGALALTWSMKATTLVGLTAPLFALVVPIFDTSVSIARRWLSGKPIFSRDDQHIHHRLLQRGFTVRRSVLTLYAMASIGAVLSLALSTGHGAQFYGPVVLLGVGLGLICLRQLEYVEFTEATRLWRRGVLEQRRLIRSQIALRRSLSSALMATSYDEVWTHLVDIARNLHFNAVELCVGGNDDPVWFRRAIVLSDSDQLASGATHIVSVSRAEHPSGWITCVPLGGAGEIGSVALWRDFDQSYPILAQSLAVELSSQLTPKVAGLLKSKAAPKPQSVDGAETQIAAGRA